MAFGSVVGQGADLATEPETRKNSHTLKRGLRTSFVCSPAFRLGSCAGTFFENQPRMNTDRKNSHTLKRGLRTSFACSPAFRLGSCAGTFFENQPRMNTDRKNSHTLKRVLHTSSREPTADGHGSRFLDRLVGQGADLAQNHSSFSRRPSASSAAKIGSGFLRKPPDY